ncbi:AAA-ATPase [Candidatus Magnetomorum sp. HK-1]|nr:AAA-ATPase [Candidatus Magnetomorum sp. HK-1]
MQKEFNDTGLCVPDRHYMVDTSNKIEKIIALMEKGKYFTINRPRQFGKTTILSLLAKKLNKMDNWLALKISFEEIDSDAYKNQERFIYIFMDMLVREFQYLNLPDLSMFVKKQMNTTNLMPDLSKFITIIARDLLPKKSIVLLVDEVDKSGNNQLFLDFLGILRNKYLQRNEGRDFTFQSVILAGVHDVKTLKAKIQSGDENKYNSPWNIAIDFSVDLSFSAHEIETMLKDYAVEKKVELDFQKIAEKIHYYTSGYPYLVSKLCKFIDELITPKRENLYWLIDDVDAAFRMIVDEGYTTTLFDSLAKNLEGNRKLYDLISQIAINGANFPFTITNPVINLAHLYGILVPSEQGRCRIHNRIFEQRIYTHIMSELLQTNYSEVNGYVGPDFYTDDGLDVKLILRRFQIFMKEHYSEKDAKFLEREGRLLFLSYLRPIINGRGFDFKEPNVSHEKRMDIVVTYWNKRHVIELKIWHGIKYHKKGLKQLSDYLDTYSLKEGALLIFDFNKNKKYREEKILFEDKKIFAVWV